MGSSILVIRLACLVLVSATAAHCSPRRPLSVLLIHGTADRPPGFEFWAQRNGCQIPRVAGRRRAECPGEIKVEFYPVTGGGHAWPAQASALVVDFFASLA